MMVLGCALGTLNGYSMGTSNQQNDKKDVGVTITPLFVRGC